MTSLESSQLETGNSAIAFKQLCPLCGCPDFIYEPISSECICSGCGLVIDTDSLDRGKEWKNFIGGDVSFPDRVGSSIIGTFMEKTSTSFYTDLDGRGRSLNVEVRHKMRRLQKQSIKTTLNTSYLRNLSIARSLIRLLVGRMKLTESFYNDTLAVYKKALASKSCGWEDYRGYCRSLEHTQYVERSESPDHWMR